MASRPTKADHRGFPMRTAPSKVTGSPPRVVRLHELSPARTRVHDLLRSIGFGRVEGLRIVDREAVLEPPPRIFRSVKLGGEAPPRPERVTGDCVLKKALLDLFDQFDRIGDGVIARLDLKDGLPCSMVVEEVAGVPQNGGAA
jgi:hypothetical protein